MGQSQTEGAYFSRICYRADSSSSFDPPVDKAGYYFMEPERVPADGHVELDKYPSLDVRGFVFTNYPMARMHFQDKLDFYAHYSAFEGEAEGFCVSGGEIYRIDFKTGRPDLLTSLWGFEAVEKYIERYPVDYINFVKDYEAHKKVSGRFVLDNGGRTIGYGHDILPGENFSNGLSEKEAGDLLIKDLNKAYDRVVGRINSLNQDYGYKISINQFTERELIFFIDFSFNRGVGLAKRDALKNASKPSSSLALLLIAVYENNRKDLIKFLMEETKSENGNELVGLVRRRMDEYEILEFGDYVRDYDENRDFEKTK